MSGHYEVPSWAGKPPQGLHLDVMKGTQLIQKLMVDEKKCHLFGRNSQLNDVCVDHASCSRVHAAFVYHKHLNIAYLVDLGSTHGTFIGSLRLESQKPTQLPFNSTFHFGASTRSYILREKPSVHSRSSSIREDIPVHDKADISAHGLPESQSDLDNLTEYNTAHNRRISLLVVSEDSSIKSDFDKKQRNKSKRFVTFNDEEIVINPEDTDPTVGRFRNLIQTTLIPAKRAKYSQPMEDFPIESKLMLPPEDLEPNDSLKSTLSSIACPNPAPDVSLQPTPIQSTSIQLFQSDNSIKDLNAKQNEAPKKKYAKEAWPGRKPTLF